jgi:hypothetical protein
MKALVIQNLNLNFNEFATSHLSKIEMLLKENTDTDIVIVAGNISTELKRSLLFAEEVSKLTSLSILYSIGISEYCSLTTIDITKHAAMLRLRSTKSRVVWAEDFIHPSIEFKHALGAPLLKCSEAEWKLSIAGRRLVKHQSPYIVNGELASARYPYGYSVDEFNEYSKTESVTWSDKKHVLLSAVKLHGDPFFGVPYEESPLAYDIRIDGSTDQISFMEL